MAVYTFGVDGAEVHSEEIDPLLAVVNHLCRLEHEKYAIALVSARADIKRLEDRLADVQGRELSPILNYDQVIRERNAALTARDQAIQERDDVRAAWARKTGATWGTPGRARKQPAGGSRRRQAKR